MIWTKVIGLFIAFGFTEYLSVKWFEQVSKGRAGRTAMVVGITVLIDVLGVRSFMEDLNYVIPIVAGAVVGSYIAVKMKSK